MKKARSPKVSPAEAVVEKIRSIRRKLLEESGGSVEHYLELLRENADASRRTGTSASTAKRRPAHSKKRRVV